MHADKRSLIVQLGLNIPIRDMRLLDFNLLSSGACRGGEKQERLPPKGCLPERCCVCRAAVCLLDCSLLFWGVCDRGCDAAEPVLPG